MTPDINMEEAVKQLESFLSGGACAIMTREPAYKNGANIVWRFWVLVYLLVSGKRRFCSECSLRREGNTCIAYSQRYVDYVTKEASIVYPRCLICNPHGLCTFFVHKQQIKEVENES